MSENGDMKTVGKFDCPDCDRKFTRQASLTKHTNSMWYKDHGPAAVQANWNKEPANSNLEAETGIIEPQPPTGELDQIRKHWSNKGWDLPDDAFYAIEALLAQAKEAGKREGAIVELKRVLDKPIGAFTRGGYIETRLAELNDQEKTK